MIETQVREGDMPIPPEAAAEAVGIHKVAEDSELMKLIRVGNADLIYKNEHGYHSFSLGNGYDKKESATYLPWKEWWIRHEGAVEIR